VWKVYLTWNEWRQVAGALGIEYESDAAASYRPRFNIAPTDQHFIFTAEFERRKAHRARWGLVNRAELTFTIVTCAANTLIAAIHDRTPVVLNERAAEDWMNPRERDPLSLKRLLVPALADLLAMRSVSQLVNNVKNDSPALRWALGAKF
jgi:putative SOS response-associated peptidase YedK